MRIRARVRESRRRQGFRPFARHYLAVSNASIVAILDRAPASSGFPCHVRVCGDFSRRSTAPLRTSLLQFGDTGYAGLNFFSHTMRIFDKLVTKVAKQSSLKVVLLQSTEENRSARDRHDDVDSPRLRVTDRRPNPPANLPGTDFCSDASRVRTPFAVLGFTF